MFCVAAVLAMTTVSSVCALAPQGKGKGKSSGHSRGNGHAYGVGSKAPRGLSPSHTAAPMVNFNKYGGNAGAAPLQRGFDDHDDHLHHRHNGYTHNHYRQFHGNPYSFSRGGFFALDVAPFGWGYPYYGNNLGVALGTSAFYQPTVPYYPEAAFVNPYTSPLPYSSYAEVLAAHDLLSANPVPATSVINQPTQAIPMIRTTPAANDLQFQAESAFRSGDYATAVRLASEVVRLDAGNGYARLFSSHSLFAVGDYDRAYAELRAASEQLGEDQLGFVIENFKRFYGQNDFVPQTDRLSGHLKSNPDDWKALVLRGFIFGALDYPEAATRDFRNALAISPTDTLAQRLLVELGDGSVVQQEIEIEPPIPTDDN